jgi:serine/threonine protein kinase
VDDIFSLTVGDIWSFGIVLYEIFTRGAVPYFSLSNETTAERVVLGYRLEKPMDCPDDVYSLMRSCWDADPSKRPSFLDIVDNIECMLRKRQKPQEHKKEQENGMIYLPMFHSFLSDYATLHIYNIDDNNKDYAT